jgi:hypothetical protein
MSPLIHKEQKRQLQQFLLRRLQLTVFLGYLVADVVASVVLFHFWPNGALCSIFPNMMVYAVQHLLWVVLCMCAIAGCWWMVGSHAYWDEMCRSHEQWRVFNIGAVWGVGINTAASLFNRSVTLGSVYAEITTTTEQIITWLVLRAALWVALYYVTTCVVLRLLQPYKHIEELRRYRRSS